MYEENEENSLMTLFAELIGLFLLGVVSALSNSDDDDW
jgi:hypothetical protein